MKRFHLSRLLLLTALAGAFIVVQFLPRYTTITWDDERTDRVAARGWPLPYVMDVGAHNIDAYGGHLYSPVGLVVNALIGLAGLALAGYVSELIIFLYRAAFPERISRTQERLQQSATDHPRA